MKGWISQKYWKVPGSVNVNEKLPPAPIVPLSQTFDFCDTVPEVDV